MRRAVYRRPSHPISQFVTGPQRNCPTAAVLVLHDVISADTGRPRRPTGAVAEEEQAVRVASDGYGHAVRSGDRPRHHAGLAVGGDIVNDLKRDPVDIHSPRLEIAEVERGVARVGAERTS